MRILTRFSMSADGYVTTPDGWPSLTADPAFASGESHSFPEFQKTLDAVLMGRTTFEPVDPAAGLTLESSRELPGGSVELNYLPGYG
jgi:dihydrofolate reductase